jgi:phosphate:Na+ symporter
MLTWELWFAIIPGLILFLYGIEHFSREIQRVAGERFRSILVKLTKRPVGGAVLGALVTAIIQSSTATTVIAVGLVNAGTISFVQSLGIMFGANVGTTITAQLIAFKLTGFAPFFILAGFLISIFGGRYKFIGKPLFYFGLVFFSLGLISDAVEPYKSDPELLALFSQFSNVFLAILAGIIAVIILQSSSVVTGIVVLLAGTGLLTLPQSIPIILGANIGTTATSLLAASRMDLYAKRTAAAHFLFNVGGVLLFLPILGPFATFVGDIGGTTAHQVANAHLIFNLTCAIIFLLALQPFKAIVERLVPGKEEEILFHTKYLEDRIPKNTGKAFGMIETEIINSVDVTLTLFEESSEFLKSGKDQRLNRVAKLESLSDFLDDRIERALFELSKRKLSKKDAERTVLLVRISNAIEQLGDGGEAFGYLTVDMSETGLSFSPESIIELEQIYEKFRDNMNIIKESLPVIPQRNVKRMRKNDVVFRELMNESYQKHLERLYTRKAYAGSSFVEALSILEDAHAHVREIRKLSELYRKLE